MAVPLLISFYTKDTIYEKEVEDLTTSCKELGVDSYIEAREDLGSWDKNCCQKPLFILECLKRYNRPLLWVDADAIVMQKPTFCNKEIDLAFYFNDQSNQKARSATIYIAPTAAAQVFVSQWHQDCLKELSKNQPVPYGDQSVLIALLRKFPLRVGHLPLAYTVIFDRDQVALDQIVILHFQASRTALMNETLWKTLSGKQLKALRMNSV